MSQSTRFQMLTLGGRRFSTALLGFLRGFVGATSLPRDRAAACHALTDQASGRDRCC
jgi:hypothetical protein